MVKSKSDYAWGISNNKFFREENAIDDWWNAPWHTEVWYDPTAKIGWEWCCRAITTALKFCPPIKIAYSSDKETAISEVKRMIQEQRDEMNEGYRIEKIREAAKNNAERFVI